MVQVSPFHDLDNILHEQELGLTRKGLSFNVDWEISHLLSVDMVGGCQYL